jgi:CheY-like chemotaxis protein
VEPGLWACRFDRNQLGQVIDNLVINAVQAMPGGGVITITARNQGEAGGSRTVRVTVADNGPGMAPEVLAHLFEPFVTTKAQGHGLGLTTCYSILRRHGGTIEAESEVGRGTRFHVILPAAQEAEVPGPPAAAPGHRGSGTVLVMDDEPDVREILRELLESFGYRVVEAASGEEAVAAVRQAPESFAAIILDLTVPGGMGGTEALGQIRTFAPRVPVLVASGYSDATTLTDPKAFGFAAGLRKPYLKTELEAVFSALVRSGNDNS